jgi:N-acyl-D-amino-acid deacylase
LVVTPGFIDIHTHFDGQATWDPILAPSAWHGITSVAMGNCGVGFAPARRDRHNWLIGLMEGVEDIPGSALAEGLSWEWESFPDYMDTLEQIPRVLDVGAHLPHAALRAFLMGDRGANPWRRPTTTSLPAWSIFCQKVFRSERWDWGPHGPKRTVPEQGTPSERYGLGRERWWRSPRH